MIGGIRLDFIMEIKIKVIIDIKTSYVIKSVINLALDVVYMDYIWEQNYLVYPKERHNIYRILSITRRRHAHRI